MSKRRGSETRHLTRQILVRVTPADYDAVARAAREARTTMAELARRRLLGLKIVTRSDLHMIAELRRQGGIALMALRTRGMAEEGRAALLAIRAVIDRLADPAA